MSRELCLMDGNTMIIGRENVIDWFVRPMCKRDVPLPSAWIVEDTQTKWCNAKLDNLLFERDIP